MIFLLENGLPFVTNTSESGLPFVTNTGESGLPCVTSTGESGLPDVTYTGEVFAKILKNITFPLGYFYIMGPVQVVRSQKLEDKYLVTQSL